MPQTIAERLKRIAGCFGTDGLHESARILGEIADEVEVLELLLACEREHRQVAEEAYEQLRAAWPRPRLVIEVDEAGEMEKPTILLTNQRPSDG